MIGCLQTHVCKQPIIALYFEFENVLMFYNLEALSDFGTFHIGDHEILRQGCASVQFGQSISCITHTLHSEMKINGTKTYESR